MTPLEITRQWECGEEAVWESEHMFGYDLFLGRIVGERYLPQVIITRQRPLSEWEWARARRACALRSGGVYDQSAAILADLALDSTPHRVHHASPPVKRR